MEKPLNDPSKNTINTFEAFTKCADYSLLNALNCDPDATPNGLDHRARQVFSGHYVPVTPKPLPAPDYVCHSADFFNELGLSQSLIEDTDFCRLFSGDIDVTRPPMRPWGWATGYALSIYGTEYTQQCPFGTGNGYGDGRAISIFEGVFRGARWEMQLKGGGPTPYCRGADGRAVLRSSVREFLAQEHMHALGIASSRSLTLFASHAEMVTRPWYSRASNSFDPDTLVNNPTAITTRVAPSFLRVGQIELYARRVRKQSHPTAFNELRMLVEHVIDREYSDIIDKSVNFSDQIVHLAAEFSKRLAALVAHWLRVGFCQGNFNSDNCPVGGFTLDYGPFGFCEIFDPEFQPWTGGGQHFSFMNQPAAAEANFHMLWSSLRLLLVDDQEALARLDDVRRNFSELMQSKVQMMWAEKLGLREFDSKLVKDLLRLMTRSEVDYTMFFRELSHIPVDASALKKSFYVAITPALQAEWQTWFDSWREQLSRGGDLSAISKKMLGLNPKYTWREWLVAPAYEQAMQGDYSLVKELQAVLSQPYDEQTQEIEDKYYRLKPKQYFNAGGVSHYSCSS